MSLIYNGTTITKLIYNNTEVQSATYNGTSIFSGEPLSDSIVITMRARKITSGSRSYYYYYGATENISNRKIISISPTILTKRSYYLSTTGAESYVDLSVAFSYNESEKSSTITISSGGNSTGGTSTIYMDVDTSFTYTYYPV